MVLQAAKASAQQRHAPSAIAVVDPAGDLLAFERMDSVRPASTDLAIAKARTAARLQRPTAEVEDNINRGRTAFVTANIAALRGGMPIRVAGEVVGAVGIAGLSKGHRCGHREHRGGRAGSVAGDSRASLRELLAYGRRRDCNPAYPAARMRRDHLRTCRRPTSAQPAVFHLLAATSPLVAPVACGSCSVPRKTTKPSLSTAP